MFMDEKLNERYVSAQERLADAAEERNRAVTRKLGLAVLLTPIAAGAWGIPLVVILWRAATGN